MHLNDNRQDKRMTRSCWPSFPVRSGIFWLLFCFWFPVAKAQNADFTADQQTGCKDLLVNFTDQSSGSPDTYQWDFGDGSANSSLEDPAHFYNAPGTYTVTLTVTKGNNSDTETKTGYITVFAPPENEFTVDDTAGCVPFTTSFTDQSSPGDGSLTDWEWDFGDGTSSSAQDPTHTYTSPGTYNVTLFTTDDNGCRDSEVKNNYITVDPLPDASFMASDTVACDTPFTVNFTNNSTGNGLSYEWFFDDGSSVSTASDPTHTFTTLDSFQVALVVTNNSGCTDTTRQLVINQSFQANFTQDTAFGCDQQTVSFSDQSAPYPNSWEWSFGDGDSSTVQDPTHVYMDTGAYTVTLVAGNNAGCTDTITRTDTVTIAPLPDVGFTAGDTTGCEVPFNVAFSDTTSNAVAWQWDFGDGGSAAVQNPAHSYVSPGVYDISLSVVDNNGCRDSITDSNRVRIIEPAADFTIDTSRGCQPLTVNFTDLSFSNEAISTWEWDFGDGNTSGAQNPSHTYTDTGSYTVSLAIENVEGCQDTIAKVDTVEVGQKPVVDFVPRDTAGCHPFTVPFTDRSSDFADEWFWDFGDGGTSNNQDPSNTYGSVDTFDVELVAGFHGCYDTLQQTEVAKVLPPKAAFTVTPQTGCDTPHTVAFNNITQVADSWEWYFGDGTTFTGQNPPNHTYTETGQFTVSLVVKDTTTLACKDSGVVNVSVSDLDAGFTQDTTVGCDPAPISFMDTSSTTFSVTSWEWSFGDGNTIGPSSGNVNTVNTTGTFQDPVHTYSGGGVYDVMLVARDNLGCRDTVRQPQYIEVKALPAPDFTADTTNGCAPLTVQFTDLSTPDSLVDSLTWAFGDGDTVTFPDPIHVYSQPGVYDVTVMVTDSFSCRDTLTKTAYINATLPSADFTYDTLTCDRDQVTFTSTSTGADLSYVWDYGDGSPPDTVSSLSTTHFYSLGTDKDTVIDVQLTAVDSNGCTGSVVKPLYFDIPDADFTIDSTSIDCPPFNADFDDASTGSVTGWEWTFGDSSGVSTVQSPSHTYSIAGIFDVSLVVATALGCTDTLVRDSLIKVGGPEGSFTYSIDSSGCFYDVTFNATTSNTDTLQWIFGDGSKASGDTVTHTYKDPGKYVPVMLIEDSVGCQVAIPIDSLIEIPSSGFQPNFTTTNATCEASDGSATVNPSGIPGPPYSYQWETGQNTATLSNVPAGVYSVTVTDSAGCPHEDSVEVQASQPPIAANFTTDTATCADNDGSATASAFGGTGPYSYSWETGLSGPTLNNVTAGTYTVSLTDVNGCTGTDSVTIPAEFPSITAAFTIDTNQVATEVPITFTDGSSSVLPITEWDWQFGDGDTLTLSSDSAVAHKYFSAGSFETMLTVTTDEGCTDSTTRTIEVIEFMKIPNVFTPNGDGDNDAFRVQASGIEEYSLKIYNRWGQLLFESERSGVEWSGRNSAGEEAPEGTYFYLLEYTLDSGDSEKLQGTVSLFR